jgi:hypothetical protein
VIVVHTFVDCTSHQCRHHDELCYVHHLHIYGQRVAAPVRTAQRWIGGHNTDIIACPEGLSKGG